MKKILTGLVSAALLCTAGCWIYTGVQQKNNVALLMEALKNQKFLKVSYDSINTSIWTHISHINNLAIEAIDSKETKGIEENDPLTLLLKTNGQFTFSYNFWKNSFILEFPHKIFYVASSPSKKDFLNIDQSGSLALEIQMKSRKWIFSTLKDESPLTFFKSFSFNTKELNLKNSLTKATIFSIENGTIATSHAIKNDKHAFMFGLDLKNYLTMRPIFSMDEKTQILKVEQVPELSLITGKTSLNFDAEVLVKDDELTNLMAGKKDAITFLEGKIINFQAKNNLNNATMTSDVTYTPSQTHVKFHSHGEVSEQFIPYLEEVSKDYQTLFNNSLKTNFQLPPVDLKDIIKLFPDLSKYGKGIFEGDITINHQNNPIYSGNLRYNVKGFDVTTTIASNEVSTIIKSSDLNNLIKEQGNFSVTICKLFFPSVSQTVEMFKNVIADLAPNFIEKSTDLEYKDMLSITFSPTLGIQNW